MCFRYSVCTVKPLHISTIEVPFEVKQQSNFVGTVYYVMFFKPHEKRYRHLCTVICPPFILSLETCL